MPHELQDRLVETAPGWPSEPPPADTTYPVLLADVLYDAYQGTLLRRIADDIEQGSFIREIDAMVGLILR